MMKMRKRKSRQRSGCLNNNRPVNNLMCTSFLSNPKFLGVERTRRNTSPQLKFRTKNERNESYTGYSFQNWTKACPLLEKSERILWMKPLSTINLQGKEPKKINDDEPRVIRLDLKPFKYEGPREQDSLPEDNAARLGLIQPQRKVYDDTRRDETELRRLRRRRRKQNFFTRLLGRNQRGRRRRRRLLQPEPVPRRVFVRVHEPSGTEPSATDSPPPPIVYAPPLEEEKPSPPVTSRLKYLPPTSSTSASSSNESAEELPPIRRFNRKGKRSRYVHILDDDSVHKVHLFVSTNRSPELRTNKSAERKADGLDDDIVRKVYFANDYLPHSQRKRQRARMNSDVDITRPGKNRPRTKPIPI